MGNMGGKENEREMLVDPTKLGHDELRTYDASVLWDSLDTKKIEAALKDCGPDPVILALGGSFNPPHVEHIEMMENARKACQDEGMNVALGVLVPSTNSHVYYKTGGRSVDGEECIVLKHRHAMCELMTQNKPWLISVPWGRADSVSVAFKLQQLVSTHLDIEMGVKNVWGADLASRCPGLLLDSTSVVVARPPFTDDIDKELERMTAKHATDERALIARCEGKARDVSSTKIRELLFDEQIDQLLEQDDWVTPEVVEYLKQNKDCLTIRQDPSFHRTVEDVNVS